MNHLELLEGVRSHPYATVIAACTINGRITALLVGAFIAQGYNINPLVAYTIFVLMDVSGDTLYYSLGRIGHIGGKRLIKKEWQKKLTKLNDGKLGKSLPRTLFSAKALGIGTKFTIVTAGVSKMPILKFYSITIPCTLILFVLYIAFGYFFGQLVLQFTK